MKEITSQQSSPPVSEIISDLEDATLFAKSAQEAHQAKQQSPTQSMEQLLAEAMEEVANRELGQPSQSFADNDPNRPETEEDGFRAGALRRERYRRSMVTRDSKVPPEPTSEL
jgi:hypothetical protein